MPLPPSLVAVTAPEPLMTAIIEAGQGFNPTTTRPEYDAYLELWRLYLDLSELDGVKVQGLIESHAAESDADVALRKKLACAFNLIPTILSMVRGYLFGEEPQFDVKGDPALAAFLENCDGRGSPFKDFLKRKALTGALVFGFIDALVQNPPEEGSPTVHLITPLQRINWSVRGNGEYNWLTFLDTPIEDPHPLARNRPHRLAWITLAKASPKLAIGMPSDTGFWVRSYRTSVARQDAAAAAVPATPSQTVWEHEADFVPTERVPVATLYHQESNDPDRPHWGISKIAMMAVLTKKIVQILSWTDEDVLANLAILALPSKNGLPPKGEDGKTTPVTLTPRTIMHYDATASNPPAYVQGSTTHIQIKIDIISAYVKEILRLGLLLGASAEADKITSGVQGVVQRNELFQELAEEAGALDTFALDVLALVVSNATGKDVSAAELAAKGVKVTHYKGPYAIEPLQAVLDNVKQIISVFRDVSPTLVEEVLKQAARAALYADNPQLETIDTELETNTAGVLEDAKTLADAVLGVKAAAATPPAPGGPPTPPAEGG